MYGLLEQSVASKVSAKLTIKGFNGVVEYVAAPLIEKFTFKDNKNTEVGIIFTKKKMDKLLEIEVADSVYAGDIQPFVWLASVKDDTDSRILTIEWDSKAKGSQSKPRKIKGSKDGSVWEYLPIQQQGTQLEEGMIESFLYQSPSFEEIQSQKDLSWVDDKDYKVLITKEETDEYINTLHQLPKDTLLSVDTETTGLRADQLRTDRIVGISLSNKKHTGVYIPLEQKYGNNNEYTTEEIMDKLKPLLDVRLDDTHLPLIGHNLGFDWKVFKMYDIELNIVQDTYMLMVLMHWARNTFIRGLKPSVEHYFNIEVLELNEIYKKLSKTDMSRLKDMAKDGAQMDELTKRKLQIADEHGEMFDFRYAPEWFYTIYGPADGDFPLWLYDEIMKPDGDWAKFNGALDFSYQLELAAIPSFSEQEFYGVGFKTEGVVGLEREAIAKRDQLEQRIYEMAGKEFNIGSSLQLGKVLFEDMGVAQGLGERAAQKFINKKSGNWKTDKDTLKRIGNMLDKDGNPRFPIVKILNEYSAVDHQISSFYSNLPKLERGGLIFPQYNQVGAATGRVTASNPNIQQMYPPVRTYITPQTDDYYFSICDFSQIERRVMGGLSHDPGINERFINDPEADSHIQTYAQMTNTPYEKVSSDQRKIGKTLNFATAYGVGDERLAMNVYGKDDATHQAMAADLRKQYFESVPMLDEYLEAQRDQAEIDGYASTFFGRQRYIKEFNYDTIKEYTREKGRRAAGNMVIQGTAADIQKLALVRLRHAFRSYGFYEDKARMIANVHDETVYQIHKSIHPFLVCKIMKEAMEIDLSESGFPPFYAGMNVGYNWKDGKRDDLEAQVLLMEEMQQKATDYLENGTPLPDYDEDNIVEFWLDTIREFSVRQIVEEVRLGYVKDDKRVPITNLNEAHMNPRISKYANYFGEIQLPINGDVFIIEALRGLSVQDILGQWNLIEQNQTPQLLDAIKYLNNERPQHVTEDNINDIGYLGKGYNAVLSKLLNEPDVTITQIILTGRKNSVIFSDGEELPVTGKGLDDNDYPYVFKAGQEVSGGPLLMSELLERDLDMFNNLYEFRMTRSDAKFIETITDMMVPVDMLNEINTDQNEAKKVILQLSGGTDYPIDGYLIEECQGLFAETLIKYYMEETYDSITAKLRNIIDAI